MSTRAYLLTRPAGNVLIYNSTLESTYQAIQNNGGLSYQVISHRDEVARNLGDIKARFGSKLVAHAGDQAAVERVSPVDVLVTESGELVDGIRIIHTPGHSPGSMCLVYDSPAGKWGLTPGK